MLFFLALILAAAAGYGVAIKWGSGISPAVAAGVGAGIALLVMVVFAVFGVGGIIVQLLSVAIGAGAVYAVRDRDFGIPAKATTPAATAGGHRPVNARPTPSSGGGTAEPTPDQDLPEPDRYSSDEEAGAAMNAVGAIQQRYESGTMSTDEIAVMGEDISRKCQGIMEYFISQGREINLYATVIHPVCAWAIAQLATTWLRGDDSDPHNAAIKRAYYDITALMKKYEHLKPAS